MLSMLVLFVVAVFQALVFADDKPGSQPSKKPRPRSHTVEQGEGMRVHLLPTDDEGVPLVDMNDRLRPDLKEEDFTNETEGPPKKKDEDDDEEEEGKGTISSGGFKASKKKKTSGDDPPPERRLFENLVTITVEACQKYRQKKRDGTYSKKHLAVLLDETKRTVAEFLYDGFENFKDDPTLIRNFARLVVPQRLSQHSSDFIKECAAQDVPELRSAWGPFYEVFARSDPCLQHSKLVSEFEGKCFHARASSALNAYQWGGGKDEYMAFWSELRRSRDKDGKPWIRWEDPMMHPQVMYPDIRNQPLWERKHHKAIAHLMDKLEQNVETFQRELQALKRLDLFQPVDDSLVGRGQWTKAVLFDGVWRHEACTAAAETCDLLRFELPGRQRKLPYIYPAHEEVVIFHGSPDSYVLPHGGVTNGRVNVHIGLEGYEDSSLNVFTRLDKVERLTWSNKKCFAFNDAQQHEVITGASDRYVLVVGIMHPDITEETYLQDFNGKTMAGEFSEEDVARLKKEARRSKKKRKPATRKSKEHTEL